MKERDLSYGVIKEGKAFQVVPLEDSFESIRLHIESLEDKVEHLSKENARLCDEKFRDNEIQRLKEKLREAREDNWRGFPITKEESEKINQWQKKHFEECHSDAHSTIGGYFTFHFTPTSIGTFGTCECSCGEKFDFQEV